MFFQQKNKAIEFDTTIYGNLFLTYEPTIHFNLSHAGKYVICAFSHKPVGIDIEKIASIDYSIAKNYFHSDESHTLSRFPNQHQLFFIYWTLKESYVKFVGKGLSIPLNEFYFSIDSTKIHIHFSSQIPPLTAIPTFEQLTIDPSVLLFVTKLRLDTHAKK